MKYIAEILTIGNEILSGRTINTNASHIARRLTSIGFNIRRMTVAMDELNEISAVFRESLSRNPNIIISSGGLGPTYDDKTSEGLAIALNLPLVYNELALKQIQAKYEKLNLEITEERRKMALMPKGAIPVENEQGIAPGIYIEYNGVEILSTPGVPREMEAVLEQFIAKYLKTKPNVVYKEISIFVEGIMESAIAPYVTQLVKKYDLYIKTHPKGYELSHPSLEIQIAGSSENEKEILNRIELCKNDIIQVINKLNGKIIESQQ
ncbi:nicotinamide mononucleotide deamidase-related protein [Acidianus brierleyi]|uniref:Competence damage-inducible protein A n=1 Tax=Acidianus brierleyi TaxID=41673 RepID=A0A2U9IF41_9CREN|nr:nicotinamide mononucleotide deamidase-related protein [Acidianus brierleyi]AWR94662.1 nicotinamide mononucleotide deamidase-related protein [Acidianus brierleyi]